MMADVTEKERYGLIGLAIGLQNKDLPLITENLLNVRLILIVYLLYVRYKVHLVYVSVICHANI